ncbi:hypothetical protein Hdeb2414_s0015g00443711 [Helianthus debilis subsp. tardiflorus]
MFSSLSTQLHPQNKFSYPLSFKPTQHPAISLSVSTPPSSRSPSGAAAVAAKMLLTMMLMAVRTADDDGWGGGYRH